MKTRQTSRHNPKQFLPFPQAQFVPFRTRHTPGVVIPRGATCLLQQETARLVQRSLRNALADMADGDMPTYAGKRGKAFPTPTPETDACSPMYAFEFHARKDRHFRHSTKFNRAKKEHPAARADIMPRTKARQSRTKIQQPAQIDHVKYCSSPHEVL